MNGDIKKFSIHNEKRRKMSKTKAELLHDIKILKHNYEVKKEQFERVMFVNGYLCDLLKEKGVSDKEINEFIQKKINSIF